MQSKLYTDCDLLFDSIGALHLFGDTRCLFSNCNLMEDFTGSSLVHILAVMSLMC